MKINVYTFIQIQLIINKHVIMRLEIIKLIFLQEVGLTSYHSQS